MKKENPVKASKLILWSQKKVLVLIWDSEKFVFTGDGFSLISGFTKILCSPENSLLIIKYMNGKYTYKNNTFLIL